MSFKVIKEFIDRYDSNHRYKVGDSYPRSGVELDEDRASSLASASNRMKVPFLEEIKPKAKPKTKPKAKPKK